MAGIQCMINLKECQEMDMASNTNVISDLEKEFVRWNNAQSVSSYLTTIVGAVVGIIALLHPGFHESNLIQALIPSVSFIIAGGVQVFNLVTHRSVQKQIVKAHTPVSISTTK